MRTIFVVMALLACQQLSGMEAVAQGRGELTGKITSTSGAPVPGATVFLAQTMRKAITDTEGRYHIGDIPVGIYDLVAVGDGFLPEEVQVVIENGKVHTSDFQLRSAPPAPDQPEPAKRGRAWKKGLDQFEKLFLGSTANAKETRILNPEVLTFSSDPITGVFRATASKPLQVENLALGYHLTFVLQSFMLDPHRQVLSYTGRPFFGELQSTDPKALARWEEIRSQTWYGSLNHLLASLAQNRLEEEGYQLKKDFMRAERQEGRIVIQEENMSQRIIDEKPLRRAEILRETPKPDEYELSFEEYVRVIYRGKVNRKAGKYRRDRSPDEQISWVIMQDTWAILYKDGSLYPANAIRVHGYMAGNRAAEMMPREYQPASWREGIASN